jgi:hypothetical protein
MKKVLYLATLLFCAVFTSCEKEKVGNTETMAMAGQWYVTVDAADESGNVVEGFEDLFGLGRHLLVTSNTAANSASEMMIDDLGNFWMYRVKVSCDINNLTFATGSQTVENLNGDPIEVTISNGKIVKDGGVQNNGSKADYIEFYVSFSDDPYPATYGYKNYKVSGIRYSGLAEND